MMNKRIQNICFFAILLLLSACGSTTRFINDGQYLLEKVDLKVEGTGPDAVDLMPFVQQVPTSNFEVSIYNSVDSTSGWWRKMVRKVGSPGVVFRNKLVEITQTELEIQMKNLGYLNAKVSSQVDTLEKKAQVTYTIIPNDPYRIREYTIKTPRPSAQRRERTETNASDSASRLARLFNRAPRDPRLIKEGSIFDQNTLELERQRVSRQLQNQGYYASNLNNIHYWADTTLRSNQVDLTLGLLDSTKMVPYTIERINVYSGNSFDRRFQPTDSTIRRDINIYWDDTHFLRKSIIAEKVLVRPKGRYRAISGENTYNQFKNMACMGRVEVRYVEGNYPDSTLLDCNIFITPGNIHSLQTAIEGTNKDGDIGAAVDVTYGHLNIFNGSEIFNLNFRAAYEFVKSDVSSSGMSNNYYEFGVKPSLSFPRLHLPYLNKLMRNTYTTETLYSIGYNIQKRSMFMRNFFNLNWKFRWSKYRSKASHTLSPIDVNYVNMPWKSAQFEDYLNNEVDSLTKYSYNNIFTAGINYSFTYSNGNVNTPQAKRHRYSLRYNVETSGNLLNWLNKKTDGERNADGQYTILGNPFAQYIKSNIDISETYQLTPESSVAFRIGAGVAYPYGNSSILPFEKRFYGGGPNHVRGWSTRELGPGAYSDANASIVSHVGDVNFITSFEYRYKVMSWLEPAWFVDAGNIWTIKDYPNQPAGKFNWDTFYKEIAVGTGIGFRLDLSFLILRLDFATRLVDPAREEGDRWVLFKRKFFPNSDWYIAIGYPF